MKHSHPNPSILKSSIAKLYRLTLLAPFALASVPAFGATFIHFEGMPHNVDIPASFADYATSDGTGFTVAGGIDGYVGTPNINIGWVETNNILDSYQGWEGRGSVLQTDYTRLNPIDIPFSPDSGFGVLLTSFDLDKYSGGAGGSGQVDWSILDGTGAIIVNGVWTHNTAGGRTTILTGMTYEQAQLNAGETITLRLNRDAGTTAGGDYFGVDNLAFDQVNVPEPTAGALGAVGLGAMAMRRRRKKP